MRVRAVELDWIAAFQGDCGWQHVMNWFSWLGSDALGFVFVEEDDHLAMGIGVLFDQLLLGFGHGASHESYDLAAAHLVEFDAIEEAFDNDKGFVGWLLYSPIQVVKLRGLAETLRELLFGCALGRFARISAGIGD